MLKYLVAIIGVLVLVLPIGIVLGGPGQAIITAKGLEVRYVDRAVAVSGDGLSWETAFRTIEEGLGDLPYGGICEVAEGFYPGSVWGGYVLGGRLLKSSPGNRELTLSQNGMIIDLVQEGEGNWVIGVGALRSISGLPVKPINYFDLYALGPGSDIDLHATIKLLDVETKGLSTGRMKLFWFNGSDWLECSDYSFNGSSVSVHFNSNTSPRVDELTGTLFGLGREESNVWILARVLPYLFVAIAIFLGLVLSVGGQLIPGLILMAIGFIVAITSLDLINRLVP